MLFNSVPFLVFFVLLFVGHRCAPVSQRKRLLLVGSLIFYAMWIPNYLVLFVIDLSVNYVLLRLIIAGRRPRLYLGVAVVFSLGVLAYFKYAAFIVDAVIPFTAMFGIGELSTPSIMLPLGISFFTFQIIALSVDTYRGRVEPVRRFGEYVLFISFFPQLIAGPIVRGWQLLPQLRSGGEVSYERNRRGLWLIALGLTKKVLVADALLAPFVDQVFSAPGFETAPIHLIAVYSFAFQIYFDFSGYTDMARGLGLLLGFDLPLNFMEPYLARNPAEFWRRWHITLSRWLRDYLYIGLGGNRAGRLRTYRNMFLTMVLGGLWHGAGWTFVIWGALHGFFLVLHRRIIRSPIGTEQSIRWRDVPSIITMFHVSCFLWIFFRAATFKGATDIIARLALGDYRVEWPVMQIAVVLLCVGFHVAERLARLNFSRILAKFQSPWGGVLEGAALGVTLALVMLYGGGGGEFIYFQF